MSNITGKPNKTCNGNCWITLPNTTSNTWRCADCWSWDFHTRWHEVQSCQATGPSQIHVRNLSGDACWKRNVRPFVFVALISSPGAKTITKHQRSHEKVDSQHFSCTTTGATPLPKLNPCKAQKTDIPQTFTGNCFSLRSTNLFLQVPASKLMMAAVTSG